jgi:hypothetical protein
VPTACAGVAISRVARSTSTAGMMARLISGPRFLMPVSVTPSMK